MKKLRDVYLIGISFIAGVLFIVQCGGAASSVADAVAEALDVNFDNTDSTLTSSNVQDALKEVAGYLESLPYVYDSAGEKLGLFLGDSAFSTPIIELWDFSRKVSFLVAIGTGDIIVSDYLQKAPLYFQTEDCSGTSFAIITGDDATEMGIHPFEGHDGNIYSVVDSGTTAQSEDLLSYIDEDGTCQTRTPAALIKSGTTNTDDVFDDEQKVYMEITSIELPDYAGPLYVR